MPRCFTLASRPRLPPLLFSHRILRREGGCGWEISISGVELADDEVVVAGESLAREIAEEMRARVRGLAEIVFSGEYEDASPIEVDGPFEAASDLPALSFADGDDPRWEDYAVGARTFNAGSELTADVIEAVQAARAAIPPEGGLRPWGKGWMYAGTSDRAHIAYLKSYLAARADKAIPEDRRKILAFLALQGREGSTAAINSYDNQLVTWGTGWGGLGGMGRVVERATRAPAVRALFARCGVRYRGNNEYDVVDVEARRIVTGRSPALNVIRSSVPLLCMLIHASRDPSTRDAVTEAQLQTFMLGSASLPRAEVFATQALFNFVAHLKHWAPGYIDGVESVFPLAGDGPPTKERDATIAVQVTRYFYARARRTKWIPDWKQFQRYWEDLREDGLDCADDALLRAPGPPVAEDPAELPSQKTASAASQTTDAIGLKSPLFAGNAEIGAAASGGAPLRKGARGSGVEALQRALVTIGVELRGGVDGIFGDDTEAAVKAFQSRHGLPADGIAGAATLQAVDAAHAERFGVTGSPATPAA